MPSTAADHRRYIEDWRQVCCFAAFLLCCSGVANSFQKRCKMVAQIDKMWALRHRGTLGQIVGPWGPRWISGFVFRRFVGAFGVPLGAHLEIFLVFWAMFFQRSFEHVSGLFFCGSGSLLEGHPLYVQKVYTCLHRIVSTPGSLFLETERDRPSCSRWQEIILARMLPTAAAVDRTMVMWDNKSVAKYGIDKTQIC